MKTLWIGCSHSAGVYDKYDNRVSHFGIPYLVSQNFDSENWKMIAAPGNGLIEYSCILTYLDNNNLLDKFNTLILQLTSEPRLVTFSPHAERLKFKKLKEYIKCDNNERSCPVYHYDNDETHPKEFFKVALSAHPVNMFNAYESTFSNKNKLLDLTENVSGSLLQVLSLHMQIHFRNIVSIVERRNIKLHTFNFSERDGVYKFLKNDDYLKYDILNGNSILNMVEPDKKKDYFVFGDTHPMEKAVVFTTKQISSALKHKYNYEQEDL